MSECVITCPDCGWSATINMIDPDDPKLLAAIRDAVRKSLDTPEKDES